MQEMLSELEPYSGYYKEQTMKGLALEYYERRLEKGALGGTESNEENMKELMGSLSAAQREELKDEYSQIQIFSKEFYSREQWLREQSRMELDEGES